MLLHEALLLTCTLLFSLQSFGQGSLEGDRLALIALYNETDGPKWFENTGWTVAGPVGSSPCGWFGVTCESGRVVGLDLSRCGLDGNIPPEIGNMDQLKSLTLGWTLSAGERMGYVYGPIPTEIGNLLNLEHLDLSGNTAREDDWRSGPMLIRGPIPSSIGNLTKLKYLDLSYLPNDEGFDPIGFINGNIPPEIGNLINLTHLNLSSQSLAGDLPAELGNLAKLKLLSLVSNDFSGEIPSSFNNFSQIELLDLAYGYRGESPWYGRLHGEVPDLSGLPLSAVVRLTGNSFTFAGLEQSAGQLLQYGNQSPIPIKWQGGKMYVEAGGTVANNTYKWYAIASTNWGVPPVLVATIVGDKYYDPAEPGIYFVEVTNSIASELTLRSVNYSLTAMPVTLAAFYGVNNPEGNLITWKTTSETNNSGFEIEKSTDGKRFEKMGFVDGSGDSKESNIYQFTDYNASQTSYYRLKQIDYDNNFQYSRIIAIKLNKKMFSVYPNPAHGKIFLDGLENREEITIRNSEGTVMLQDKVLSKEPVKVDNLLNGMYTVTVGDGTKKIVIQN
jgi:Leucine-rich repeat (LRR) protein